MSRKHYQPNSKIILLLFTLLFVILLLGTWVSSILVQEQQDLRNQAYISEVVGATCNESCSTHADCQASLICFDQRCRLSTNPTDTYCQGVPDQGIHRSCNQYCADHNECQKGLVCYYNACRNPYNITNETCTLPTPIPTQSISITNKVTPVPTATQIPKGGVFTSPLPKTTTIPTATVTAQPFPTSTAIISEKDNDLSLYEDVNHGLDSEMSVPKTPLQLLSSIPSYMLYGIGTLVIFFIALIIYIVHTWKTPTNTLRKSNHKTINTSPYDMKSFAGNMDAHVKEKDSQ